MRACYKIVNFGVSIKADAVYGDKRIVSAENPPYVPRFLARLFPTTGSVMIIGLRTFADLYTVIDCLVTNGSMSSEYRIKTVNATVIVPDFRKRTARKKIWRKHVIPNKRLWPGVKASIGGKFMVVSGLAMFAKNNSMDQNLPVVVCKIIEKATRE